MSHTQQQLTSFDSGPDDKSASSSGQSNKDTSTECVEVNTSETPFSIPESFPDNQIDTLSSGEITVNLCTPSETVSPTFKTVAGSGGMGSNKPIKNAGAVVDVATTCIGLPVLLTGGGMNTPMGSGTVLGCLRNVEQSKDSVTVKLQELYRQRGAAQKKTRTARLGAYELSVPQSLADCQKAILPLSAWENDEMDYLNPVKRQKHEFVQDRLDTFKNLTPADKVKTPEYASRLEVVSHPFETYAVIPRGTLSNRTVEVLAVVVNNPNGGYYQLGIEKSSSGVGTSEILTCYMGVSSHSPPTPNTAFTRDAKFSSTDLEVTPIEHPPDPEIILPNQEVVRSPLPEPRMQTPLDELNGIGEKTARKLRRATDEKVSAESIAYTMFGDGDIHSSTLGQIKGILESLPQKTQVYNQLKAHIPDE